MRMIALLVVVSALSIPANADAETGKTNESELTVNGIVGAAGMLGYEVPTLGVALGTRVRLSDRFALLADINHFPRAHKYGIGDGRKTGGSLGVRTFFSEYSFVDVGAAYVEQTTSRWTKDALYVGGGVGFRIPEGAKLVIEVSAGASYDVHSFNHGVSVGGGIDLYRALNEDKSFGLVGGVSLGYLNWIPHMCETGSRRHGLHSSFNAGIYFKP